MIAVLAPAKTLSPVFKSCSLTLTLPSFPAETDALATRLKQMTKGEVKSLMKLSDVLADTTFERIQNFALTGDGLQMNTIRATFAATQQRDDAVYKMAVCAFDGPVYRALDAPSLSDFDPRHIAILNGLYGILKPSDMIQDHRLEFNTKFRISPSCDTLYQYWNDKITQHLNHQFRELVSVGKGKGTGVKILLDCASAEYMKSIQRNQLDKDIHIVEIVLQHKGKVNAAYAKRARGLFARWVIQEGIAQATSSSTFEETIQRLQRFDREGYQYYVGKNSTPTKLFFNRDVLPPDAMTGDGEEGDESEAVKGKELGEENSKGKGKKRVDDSDGDGNKTKKMKGKS